MELSSLPLPSPLITAYEQRGIRELYPPQELCVEKGLLTGSNLLISIPTASGKTLLAEMAMWSRIAEGGKCLYIVPLRALASEKYDEFSQRGSVRVGIATGDFDRTDNHLGKNDIIVVTSEKVDSLLRNRAPWLSLITCVILDEVHLIGSEGRGVTLEMVITKLRFVNPKMQVIGLSATIGNPKELASWMGAEPVISSWRPVDLKQGVFCNNIINFNNEERKVKAVTKHNDLNLCLDTLEEGGQCLVFVSSRRNAEGFAKKAALALKTGSPDSKVLADKLRTLRDKDFKNVLADCVEKGCAFHHAGLLRAERSLVEEGFRKGYIEVISATPTLAAGLNLPARRVIIRDYLRFTAGLGMVPIPVMEYQQMAGRAGRPHLDPYGEAVLIAKDMETAEKLHEYFLDSGSEEIRSMVTDEPVLGGQILSLIATGFANDAASLTDFMSKTFYAYQHPKSRSMPRVVEELTDYLIKGGFVQEIDGFLSATSIGSLVSKLYIDPRGALQILNSLENAERITLTGLLHLLATTPNMVRLYLKSADSAYLKNYLYKHNDDLIVPIPYEQEEEDLWLSALKTALILSDYAEEVSDAKIEERYGVGAGDLYNVIDGAKWLLHAADRLVSITFPEKHLDIATISLRIQHGIKEELVPLVKIRNVGRIRARSLYNKGITTPAEVVEAGVKAIARLFGQNIAVQIIADAEKICGIRGKIKSDDLKKSDDLIDSDDLKDFDDLTSLPGIGRGLAGKLKDNGILTVADLFSAGEEKIADIIGAKRSNSIFATVQKESVKPVRLEKTGQQSFADFYD